MSYCKYLLIVFIIFSSLGSFAQHNWTIQDDYKVEFSGFNADGTFRGLKGTIIFDPNHPELATFNVQLDPSTISTGIQTKNKHARGESWFNVAEYPKIAFVSNSAKKYSDGYLTKGILTLHGTEKQASIAFNFIETGENTAIFKGGFEVDREEYGIEGPFAGFVVGDEFDITITVPVQRSN